MNARKMTLAFALAAFCLAASLFGADNLFNGTWKLNVAKSKFIPGPGPQEETATVKGENGSYTENFKRKTAAGETIEGSYVAKDDGTPAPLTGSPVADMISVRKINDRTVERKLMKAGKIIRQDRDTVSPDGKTITVTGSGLNKSKFTAVYEKQP
jgi:hypothetical protein